MFLNTLFSSVGIVVVICVVTPWFLCALIPLGKIYHAMQQYYVRSSREIKRLDSISRSPIYAHFSETLSGISTIRSFNKQVRPSLPVCCIL
jgi:ATP-binding cassette subfamily C (CFTR/MRP) protein 1